MKAIIAGAGIGGLTAALTLDTIGWDVDVYESAAVIEPLGAGINLLPHGAAILHQLGLGPALEKLAIRTRAIEYRTRFGHLISSDLRGLNAGYDFPQYSVHRGHLQKLLLATVIDRLGAEAVQPDCRLSAFNQTHDQVDAYFDHTDADQPQVSATADILIGADGLHSAVRKQLHPDEGPARYEGTMMWRGMCSRAPFGDGQTMFIAGNHDVKLVCYPVSEAARLQGSALINWVAEVRNCSPREAGAIDWTRQGTRDFIESFNDFSMPDIDVMALLNNTNLITQYPMVDRDPLDWWTCGRVTLLGDAAHPMYPIGANGASQALLDCQALADALQATTTPAAGLSAYEQARRLKTSEVVLANRQSGPEKVLDIANERLTGPNDRIEDLISEEELEAVAKQYRSVAGFKKTTDS